MIIPITFSPRFLKFCLQSIAIMSAFVFRSALPLYTPISFLNLLIFFDMHQAASDIETDSLPLDLLALPYLPFASEMSFHYSFWRSNFQMDISHKIYKRKTPVVDKTHYLRLNGSLAHGSYSIIMKMSNYHSMIDYHREERDKSSCHQGSIEIEIFVINTCNRDLLVDL